MQPLGLIAFVVIDQAQGLQPLGNVPGEWSTRSGYADYSENAECPDNATRLGYAVDADYAEWQVGIILPILRMLLHSNCVEFTVISS